MAAAGAIYSGLSKSNLKDYYGDAVIKQCLRKIAKINEFPASDEIVVSDEADRTSAGRLLQSRGPAVANDRSPTVTHHILTTPGRQTD